MSIHTMLFLCLLFSRPAIREELFNLCHALARNVIECIFGVIKHRFRILLLPPEYSIEVQAFIPVALCILHNIITSHNEPENNSIMQDWAASIERGDGIEEDTGDEEIRFEDGREAEVEVEEISPVNSKALRDTIAEAMWNDYQGHLQTRGEL